MRFPQFIAVTSLAFICALAPVRADKRVALVIGNERYANLPAHEQLLDEFIRQYGNVPVYGALVRQRWEELAKAPAKELAKPAVGQQTVAVVLPVPPTVPAADPCSGLVKFPSYPGVGAAGLSVQ